MSLAFKRMYTDIPPDTHEKLKVLAASKGMSQKALVAELIESACNQPEPKTRGKRSKRSK